MQTLYKLANWYVPSGLSLQEVCAMSGPIYAYLGYANLASKYDLYQIGGIWIGRYWIGWETLIWVTEIIAFVVLQPQNLVWTRH